MHGAGEVGEGSRRRRGCGEDVISFVSEVRAHCRRYIGGSKISAMALVGFAAMVVAGVPMAEVGDMPFILAFLLNPYSGWA